MSDNVHCRRRVVLLSDGVGGRRDFWSSKCHVGGPGNALKV